MVSKGKPSDRFTKHKQIAYMDLLSKDKVSQLCTNLMLPMTMPQVMKDYCNQEIANFLCAIQNDVMHLKSVHSLEEYYQACKDRYQDLSSICQHLLTADDEGIQVARKRSDGSFGYYLIGKNNRKVVLFQNGEEFFSRHRRPGSYKYLFRMIPEIIETLNILTNSGDLDFDEYHTIIRELSLVITTIAKVYEDIRGGYKFQEAEYQKAISRMEATHELDHDSKYWELFNIVRKDIEEGINQPRFAKTYIKDICQAISQPIRPFEFEDYHFSLKSTGTSWNDKPIPGLFASMIEVDNTTSNDDLIGYVSHYNKESLPNVKQFDRKSIMIKQHKLDYRLIHMASNAIQDRANYYHRRLVQRLDKLRTDCTKDQSKGITFAKLVTSPNYRAKWHNNVYCLDISKATDTLNQEFQKEVISIFLGREHADNWSNIVTGVHSMVYRQKVLCQFTQHCGQPQGYKSSFPSFALVHHIVMRMTMRAHGLEDMNPADFYRVLGDDSIISVVDTEEQDILHTYVEICQFINWDINLNKGYKYLYGEDSAFAEFAKVRVLDGEYCTPIPIRLLINSTESEESMLSYLWWISKYFRRLDIVQALYWVKEVFPQLTSEKAGSLLYLAELGISIFKDFDRSSDTNQSLDHEKVLCYLAYIKCKLRQTILNQFIPDSLLSEKDKLKQEKLDSLIGGKFESELFPMIEDVNHKYLQLLQRNEDIIQIVKSFFNSSTMEAIGIASLQLNDAEKDSIIHSCEILEGLEGYQIVPPFDEVQSNLDSTLKILQRFNHRSEVTSAQNESELYDNYCISFMQYLETYEQELVM